MISLFANAAVTALLATYRHPLNIYIEDTDAYKVVFYSNYFRFAERAAHAAIGASTIGSALRPVDGEAPLLLGLQSANGIKYAAAAQLGDSCEMEVNLQGLDSKGRLAMKAVLIREDGKELWSASDLRFGFHKPESGRRQDSWPLDGDAALSATAPGLAWEEEALPEAPDRSRSPQLVPSGLRLQADEASAAGTVDLHAVLRYFERHRTTFLGGPSALESLMSRAGVNVVVGRINNLQLLPEAHTVGVGEPLEVRCDMRLKARGSQVIFDQWLVHGDTAEVLARGEVTCLLIDPVAGKIVPAPEDILDQVKPWIL